MSLILEFQNNKNNTIPETTVEELMDLIESCEQLDDEIREAETFDRVYGIAQAIANSRDPQIVIEAFDRDDNFHNAFNNGGDCLENIYKYLESSYETYWGDVARKEKAKRKTRAFSYNGVFKKIKTICSRYTSTSNIDEKVFQRRSTALPDASLYAAQIKVIREMGKAVTAWQANPSITLEQAKEIWKKIGIQMKDSNPKAYEKVTVAQILKALGLGAGGVYGIIDAMNSSVRAGLGVVATTGSVLRGLSSAAICFLLLSKLVIRLVKMGQLSLSFNKKPIGERGWTQKTLSDACKEICTLLDEASAIAQSKTPTKNPSGETIRNGLAAWRLMCKLQFAYLAAVVKMGRSIVTVFGGK